MFKIISQELKMILELDTDQRHLTPKEPYSHRIPYKIQFENRTKSS